MKLNAIHARLPSSDLDATASFYAKLGFEGQSRWHGYLMLSNGPHEIHFGEEEGPIVPQAGVYLRVSDIAKWAAPFGATVEEKPWGMREFALTDPDGNHIRIGEDMQECP